MTRPAKYAKLLSGDQSAGRRHWPLIAQALYLGGDYAGATALAQKNIDAANAAGQKPARNDLDIIMAAQVKQKDEAGAEKTLETLVATYNTPEDWKQLMERVADHQGHARHRLCLYGPPDVPAGRQDQPAGRLAGRLDRQQGWVSMAMPQAAEGSAAPASRRPRAKAAPTRRPSRSRSPPAPSRTASTT